MNVVQARLNMLPDQAFEWESEPHTYPSGSLIVTRKGAFKHITNEHTSTVFWRLASDKRIVEAGKLEHDYPRALKVKYKGS